MTMTIDLEDVLFYGGILVAALISIGSYYMEFNRRWERNWLNSTVGAIVVVVLYLIVAASFVAVIVSYHVK